jgi:hypothetical protein
MLLHARPRGLTPRISGGPDWRGRWACNACLGSSKHCLEFFAGANVEEARLGR